MFLRTSHFRLIVRFFLKKQRIILKLDAVLKCRRVDWPHRRQRPNRGNFRRTVKTITGILYATTRLFAGCRFNLRKLLRTLLARRRLNTGYLRIFAFALSSLFSGGSLFSNFAYFSLRLLQFFFTGRCINHLDQSFKLISAKRITKSQSCGQNA